MSDDDTFVRVTPDTLHLSQYVAYVEDDSAGAVATFSGVTRNVFQGKRVIQLEYEAYDDMAEKVVRGLCQQARSKWSLTKVAVAHKTGLCPVGETSVVIAVSSTHRQDALQAVAWLIDELKAKVPIWKKEVFEGGEVWKENVESRLLAQRSQ